LKGVPVGPILATSEPMGRPGARNEVPEAVVEPPLGPSLTLGIAPATPLALMARSCPEVTVRPVAYRQGEAECCEESGEGECTAHDGSGSWC
jgi:hypothetical protein